MRRAPPEFQRKMYVGIPHSLLMFKQMGDPVLAAAQRRVRLFYKQTFWANAAAHQACMAALALAKRQLNVDCLT